ncbi:MAG: N-(5'-phosphoribosyl)anthranilate isomerase [Maritimibacter sp.]|jgi:hypothetical protein
MTQVLSDFSTLPRPIPLAPERDDPDLWLTRLFTSQPARNGAVIRRKASEIERHVGWDRFLAELEQRGYRALENAGQVLIFCNAAPIRPVWG